MQNPKFESQHVVDKGKYIVSYSVLWKHSFLDSIVCVISFLKYDTLLTGMLSILRLRNGKETQHFLSIHCIRMSADCWWWLQGSLSLLIPKC